MNSSDYQYLTREERKACKSSPMAHLGLVPLGKQRIESIRKNYSLSKNREILKSDDKEELRIVVIGKTGVGKSATANTILRKNYFKEDMKAESVTISSKCVTKYIEGRRIRVIDTPGLHDTRQKEEVILNEISRVIQIFDSGIHAFLYVFNMASPRFTEEDRTTLKAIEKKFGGNMVRYRLVVYTHAENNLDDKVNLDEFIDKQKKDNPVLQAFFEEANENIVAVNNKTSILAERVRNQEVIIAMVDQLRELNKRQPVYTNDMFENASERRIKLKNDVIKNGCNTGLVTVLQTVYAFNEELLKKPKKLLDKLRTSPRKEKELSKKFENQELEGTISEIPSHDETDDIEKIEDPFNGKDEMDQCIELVNEELTVTGDGTETALKCVTERHVEEVSQGLLHQSSLFQKFMKWFWQSLSY